MKKFTSCICNKVNGLVLRARTALSNQRGDFYISDAVKTVSYTHLDVYKRQDLSLTGDSRRGPGTPLC